MAVSYLLDLLEHEGSVEPHQMDDAFKYFALNLILYNIVKLNYKAFLQKAIVPAYRKMGGVDSYGNRWIPLSPRTVAFKKKHNYRYAGAIAINIRTRRLLEALKPGWFRNGVYVPRNSDQIVRVTLDEVHFEVAVPYAQYVDNARPIYALNSKLLYEAVERSAPVIMNYWNRREVKRRMAARRRIERVREDYNRRKKLRDTTTPATPDSLE